MKSTQYELTFVGGAIARYFPRYRRMHATLESAQTAAYAVRAKLQDRGLPTACHQPIIFVGDKTINWSW